MRESKKVIIALPRHFVSNSDISRSSCLGVLTQVKEDVQTIACHSSHNRSPSGCRADYRLDNKTITGCPLRNGKQLVNHFENFGWRCGSFPVKE